MEFKEITRKIADEYHNLTPEQREKLQGETDKENEKRRADYDEKYGSSIIAGIKNESSDRNNTSANTRKVNLT